ncbi:MAG: response regulator [Desulfuromonadaceae bacterium]|nr:response regulator [Desulfuromonadaceae bacterium]MDD2855230.1 response regulator [Desulfuromonadaceae bacterium]
MTVNNEQIKILCVDDEHNVLRALQRIFMDDDYEIVIAGSAQEGLKSMEESGPFQVVISDYRMPATNGVEFLKEVNQRWPETVRIILSGYADAGAIVSAINEGQIYKFIPKPWNDTELRVTIQNGLERYSLLKRNRELLEELAASNHILEEKVLLRTEQLELRNRALEFSQSLLGNLPVGVVGVDASGMIAYANDMGVEWLKPVCSEIFGADIVQSCSMEFVNIVSQIREKKSLSNRTSLGGKPCLLLGRTIKFYDNDAVVIIFLEV